MVINQRLAFFKFEVNLKYLSVVNNFGYIKNSGKYFVLKTNTPKLELYL